MTEIHSPTLGFSECWRRLAICGILLLVMFIVAAPAMAQPEAMDSKLAERFYAKGKALSNRKDHQGALREYRKAIENDPAKLAYQDAAGNAAATLDEHAAASDYYLAALAIQLRQEEKDDRAITARCAQLTALWQSLGYEEAYPHYERFQKIAGEHANCKQTAFEVMVALQQEYNHKRYHSRPATYQKALETAREQAQTAEGMERNKRLLSDRFLTQFGGAVSLCRNSPPRSFSLRKNYSSGPPASDDINLVLAIDRSGKVLQVYSKTNAGANPCVAKRLSGYAFDPPGIDAAYLQVDYHVEYQP